MDTFLACHPVRGGRWTETVLRPEGVVAWCVVPSPFVDRGRLNNWVSKIVGLPLKGFEVAGKNFGRPIEAYLAAAVLYFVMCYALSWSVKRLHQRIAIIR